MIHIRIWNIDRFQSILHKMSKYEKHISSLHIRWQNLKLFITRTFLIAPTALWF